MKRIVKIFIPLFLISFLLPLVPLSATIEGFLLEHKFYEGDYLRYELAIQGEELAGEHARPFESTLRLNLVVIDAVQDQKRVKIKVVLDTLIKTNPAHSPPSSIFFSREGSFRITPDGKFPEPFFDEQGNEVTTAQIFEEPLSLTLERSGKILEFKGNEKIEAVFPELDLLSLIKVMEAELPAQRVEIGQTWTSSQPLSLPKGVTVLPKKIAIPKLELTYTLLGWEKVGQFHCLKIGVQGKSRITKAQIPLGMKGKTGAKMNARVDSISEAISGTLYFYPKEGLILRSEYLVENQARFLTRRKKDWLRRSAVEKLNCRAKIICRLL